MPLGSPRSTCEDNIRPKMYLKETGEEWEWDKVASSKSLVAAFMNTVINIGVP